MLAVHLGLELARVGQVMPQPLQLVALERRSTSQPSVSVPLQFANPALQVMPQAPPVHAGTELARTAHAVPHALQFVTDDCRFVSQPLVLIASQLPKPMSQRMPQAPATQVGCAFVRVGHALLQAPQFAISVCPSMQERIHVSSGAIHRARHTPAEQNSVAPQARPHVPQSLIEVCRFTSQPSVTIPLQFA